MTRAALFVAVPLASFVLGYLAHNHKPVIVERTRTEYRDRIVDRAIVANSSGHVVQVAGPVRTVVKRELVAGKCEETRIVERGPVTTERQEQRREREQTHAETHTRVETREIAGQRPGWAAGAYAAIRGAGPAAGLMVDRRIFGPVSLSLGAMVGTPGQKLDPVGFAGLRVSW